MASHERPGGEYRPSWEEYQSSHITGTVYGKPDTPVSGEHTWPRCDIDPDSWRYPHVWSETHAKAAQAAIPLLKEPTEDLLHSIEILPGSSAHFEHWQIRIDLDEVDDDGKNVPLEDRIWVTGQLRGLESEITPREVLALVADKLIERIAIEAKTEEPR